MLKPHISGKSDVCKNFSLVFGTRHDVHDSASYDILRFMDRLAARVGSGPRTSQISGSGRVTKFGPACNSGTWLMDHVYISIVLVVVET